MVIDYLDASAVADMRADVCILESGTWAGCEATQDLCAGASVGTFDLDPAQARMRAFGGSARLWGGGCVPLAPMDFESRDWVPGSGWPIHYDTLAPYYERARHFFGIEHDLVPGSFSGRKAYTPLMFDDPAITTRFSTSSPTNFSRDHRALLERASHVRLVLNATVEECNAFESGGAVESVTVRTPDGRRNVVRAGYFVLACGGIENPRLLLLSSGITPRGLGNDYDQVGRRFMDHPTCRLGRLAGDTAERALPAGDGPTPLYPQVCLSEDGQRILGVLNARVRLSPVEGEPAPGIAAMRAFRASLRTPPDVSEGALLEQRICEALDHRTRPHGGQTQTTNDAAWRLALRTGLGAADLLHALARRLTKRTTVPPAFVDLFGLFEQAPNPQSRVMLGDGVDPFGQRRVAVDWRVTELDLHTFRTTARVFGDGLARVSGARFEPEPWIAEGGAPPELFGTAHHMGTTRMSDDPRDGVVNRNCRVHGIDNLYVAGSSVFTTAGWAFPTFTIGALGLRLAEHLLMRLDEVTGSSWASERVAPGNDDLSLRSSAGPSPTSHDLSS